MKLLLSLFILFSFHPICFSQPGALDSSFGENGKVLNLFYGDICKGTVQQDDKILVTSNSKGFTTGRYLPDGSIDKSFGRNGSINLPDALIDNATPYNVISLKNGSILVVGSSNNIILTKYIPIGLPDSSFGTNGIQEIDFGQTETAFDIKVQEDGKIVTAGYTVKDFYLDHPYLMVCRFMPDGSVDKSFGDSGKAVFTGYEDAQANALVIQPDGKIVAGGRVGIAYYSQLLVRFTADGKVDNSFGKNGVVISHLTPNKAEYILSMAAQEDGKIITAGGNITGLTPTSQMVIARYNTDGSLDKTFGKEGLSAISFLKYDYAEGNSVLVQPDGKVLAGGSTSDNEQPVGYFALCRLNTNGKPDSTFDEDGKQTTEFLSGSSIYSLVLQKNGKPVAVGFSANEDFPYSIALARYYGDPVKQQNPIAKKIRRWIRNHTLNWQPVNDNDVSYYSIQQSSNGVNGFREIARVKTKYEIGNMNDEMEYSYNLTNASANSQQSSVNYYRVTAVSTTGSNITSDVIADEGVSTITISPNPVKNVMKISGLPANQKSIINIINRNGNILQSSTGNNSILNMNVSQLKSGIYNVQVISNGKAQTVKMIKE